LEFSERCSSQEELVELRCCGIETLKQWFPINSQSPNVNIIGRNAFQRTCVDQALSHFGPLQVFEKPLSGLRMRSIANHCDCVWNQKSLVSHGQRRDGQTFALAIRDIIRIGQTEAGFSLANRLGYCRSLPNRRRQWRFAA